MFQLVKIIMIIISIIFYIKAVASHFFAGHFKAKEETEGGGASL